MQGAASPVEEISGGKKNRQAPAQQTVPASEGERLQEQKSPDRVHLQEEG